jgi:hypothetical protein
LGAFCRFFCSQNFNTFSHFKRPFFLVCGQFPGLFVREKQFFFAAHLPLCEVFSGLAGARALLAYCKKAPAKTARASGDISVFFSVQAQKAPFQLGYRFFRILRKS